VYTSANGYQRSGEIYRLYCGIFAQSKNWGAREIEVTSEQLRNNTRFSATAAKQTTERLLLGSRFLDSKYTRVVAE
jgi:hypothetical protein